MTRFEHEIICDTCGNISSQMEYDEGENWDWGLEKMSDGTMKRNDTCPECCRKFEEELLYEEQAKQPE